MVRDSQKIKRSHRAAPLALQPGEPGLALKSSVQVILPVHSDPVISHFFAVRQLVQLPAEKKPVASRDPATVHGMLCSLSRLVQNAKDVAD